MLKFSLTTSIVWENFGLNVHKLPIFFILHSTDVEANVVTTKIGFLGYYYYYYYYYYYFITEKPVFWVINSYLVRQRLLRPHRWTNRPVKWIYIFRLTRAKRATHLSLTVVAHPRFWVKKKSEIPDNVAEPFVETGRSFWNDIWLQRERQEKGSRQAGY